MDDLRRHHKIGIMFSAMPLSALILRVLLALALVLNGSGYAVAATTMAFAAPGVHGGHGRIADSGRLAQDGACHERADATQVHAAHSAAIETQDPADGAMPGHDDSDTPECCQGAQCHCPCVQQLAATLSDPCLRDTIVDVDAGMQAMRSGHPAPPLPHLIRPPIG